MAGLTIANPDADALVWLRPRRRNVRPRVVAVCGSVADTISAAGGWLFDRGLAGCEAIALVTDHTDDRALRIVGAQAIELDTPQASQVLSARPETLVVAAELFRHDPPVQQSVLEAIGDGLTKIMVCGDDRPAEFEGLGISVQHRLSIAAQAFKKEALAALGASVNRAGRVEEFSGIDLRALRSKATSRTDTEKLAIHGRTA